MRVADKGWTGILLAITLVVASFQFALHSVQAKASDPDLIAFLAIGGSLDELCLAGEEPSAHGDCPFCRELDLPAMPRNSGMAQRFLAETTAFFVIPRADHLLSEQTLRPPARAPPAA